MYFFRCQIIKHFIAYRLRVPAAAGGKLHVLREKNSGTPWFGFFAS